jgi:hypothetical protein
MIGKKNHTLKNKMRVESVTGKASVYVEQDFRAQALVFNMTQDLITGAGCGRNERTTRNNPGARPG